MQSHAHENKQGHETKNSIMETVEEIHLAEQEAQKIKEESKKSLEDLNKQAKENLLKFSSETEKEVTLLKNNLIKEAEKKIEQDITKVLDDAKKESQNLRKQSFNNKDLQQTVKNLMFNDDN